MKRFSLLIIAFMVLVLSGCDKESIEAKIPDNVSNEQVQEYVDKNYPEYSEDVSDILSDDTDSVIIVEDVISKSLNDNLNGMLDIYEEINCWIDVTESQREVLVDLKCYDTSINDKWSDINSSMYLLGYVLNDLDDTLDSFMNYGLDVIDKSNDNNVRITFNYYNESRECVQYLGVVLKIVDNELHLERIGIYEPWMDPSGKISFTRMLDSELYESEYFPFTKCGVSINTNGEIRDAYKYVG